MPHQILFKHQLGYVQHLTWKALHTKCDKHHFYFCNLSKYKTWRENVWRTWHIISPPS